MVHALHEAHRVLKPNGLLVDLRPAAVHRHVGIAGNGCYQRLGTTQREKFDDNRAANRAVAHVLREGLFTDEWRTQFDCTRVMDTLAEFRTWIVKFVKLNDLPPHDWLLQRVECALQAKRGKRQIV